MRRQLGLSLLELLIVISIISLLIAALYPIIKEPIFNARIRGGIAQAKEVVSACNLVRVKPVSSTRVPLTLQIKSTFVSDYNNWTDVSVLQGLLSSDYVVPTVNSFGRPYYFKLNASTCLAAVEVDELIDGWEDYPVEVAGNRTRIIVSMPARTSSGPSWVGRQKVILNGEDIR